MSDDTIVREDESTIEDCNCGCKDGVCSCDNCTNKTCDCADCKVKNTAPADIVNDEPVA